MSSLIHPKAGHLTEALIGPCTIATRYENGLSLGPCMVAKVFRNKHGAIWKVHVVSVNAVFNEDGTCSAAPHIYTRNNWGGRLLVGHVEKRDPSVDKVRSDRLQRIKDERHARVMARAH